MAFAYTHIVCPYDGSCLGMTNIPTAQFPGGQNALTCRVCPYQFPLDRGYHERTAMKKKQKDDIMGEEQSDLPINEGMLCKKQIRFIRLKALYSCWRLHERHLRLQRGIFLSAANQKCRRASYIFLQGKAFCYLWIVVADKV
jgi:hypothetical protein